MALPEPTLAMQVLADENLIAMIMDNVENPQVLFNLVVVLPVAKVTFERSPRHFLMAALSMAPTEIRLLAILYISLEQDHAMRASMISTLWAYLRLESTPGIVKPTVASADLVIPKISDPFETLRKLAAVWSAVEDLASGYAQRAIEFIQDCNSADTKDLGAVYYEGGHRFRPLCYLWNQPRDQQRDPHSEGYLKILGPWSLPLTASEAHRIKRALWRLEIFAIVSYEPHTFPNENAVDSGAVGISFADPIDTLIMPRDYDEGTRMVLASLDATGLAELESIYDYLWCAVIKPVFQHNLDSSITQYNGDSQQAQAKHKATASSSDSKAKQNDHDDFRALFLLKTKIDKVKKDFDCYLNYLMSLGLPFLHRVYQQTLRDYGKIIPENYPPLRYRSSTGLRDSWNDMDKRRNEDIRQSYDSRLIYTRAGQSIYRKQEELPDREDRAATNSYLAGQLWWRVLYQYHINDLWRAGCYMWDPCAQIIYYNREEGDKRSGSIRNRRTDGDAIV